MKHGLIGMRHWLQYWLNRLSGKAAAEVDFDVLMRHPRFAALESQFTDLFEQYVPFEWEPLHSFYETQGIKMPPSYFLKRQAARLSSAFILMIEAMHRHQLPPNCLDTWLKPEEMDIYHALTQRYLQELESWQLWPLGFFYTASAHVLKKQHALACERKERATFVMRLELLGSDLQMEVA